MELNPGLIATVFMQQSLCSSVDERDHDGEVIIAISRWYCLHFRQ